MARARSLVWIAGLVAVFAMFPLAAESASRGYPRTVRAAVVTLYAPEKVSTLRVCKQTLFDAQGAGYYALAWVRRSTGKRGQAAFQFINTAGWFAMWRDGRATHAVPVRLRAGVNKKVARLQTECG